MMTNENTETDQQPLAIPPGYVNIMGFVDESEVNGPGRRAVIWVQGCQQECPGCVNPASWSFEENQLVSVESLAQRILANNRIQGVTFAGGEPFWQAPALADLARQVKATGLNVLCFTGFTIEKLQIKDAPMGSRDLLMELDFIVDGPYVEALATNDPDAMVASSNQRFRVLDSTFRDRLNP